MNLSDILKDSEYKLSQFKPDEVDWLEQSIFLKASTKGNVPYIKYLVRGKDIKLTPEIAKTGVEKAIEQNEEVAINWITQQLKNLEIKNSPPFLRGAGGDQPC